MIKGNFFWRWYANIYTKLVFEGELVGLYDVFSTKHQAKHLADGDEMVDFVAFVDFENLL